MRALKQDGGLFPAIHYFSPLSHSQRDDSQPGPSGLKSEATKGGLASLHFPPPAPCHASSCPQKKRSPRKFFWIISMLIALRMLWWQRSLGISFPFSGWLLNRNTYVPSGGIWWANMTQTTHSHWQIRIFRREFFSPRANNRRDSLFFFFFFFSPEITPSRTPLLYAPRSLSWDSHPWQVLMLSAP